MKYSFNSDADHSFLTNAEKGASNYTYTPKPSNIYLLHLDPKSSSIVSPFRARPSSLLTRRGTNCHDIARQPTGCAAAANPWACSHG